MKTTFSILFATLLGSLFVSPADAACVILNSQGSPVVSTRLEDPLARLLARAAECPADVFQFRNLIQKHRMALQTTMVANRGFHNPAKGSFSLFESVTGPVEGAPGRTVGPGEFFFGHFTAVGQDDSLVADQTPGDGALMIEALAWDPVKGFYNFYELIGTGTAGQWFYRGDSADIVADIQLLHRQPDPKRPVFGNRLRCSGCHVAGGPILKELATPHNDWWTPARGLDLGGRKADGALSGILANLVPAEKLAQNVGAGLKLLESSAAHQAVKSSVSLQESLRPLFCPLEVNFESDLLPQSEKRAGVQVPRSFWVDPTWKLSERETGIEVRRADYEAALRKQGSRFPETHLADADHAWLAPVKAESDRLAVKSLVAQGVIDDEFVADALAVDFANPVTSDARCGLLRFVPAGPAGATATVGGEWRARLIQNLAESKSPSAAEFHRNLTDPARQVAYHEAKVAAFLKRCGARLRDSEQVSSYVALLDQRRNEVRASEISQNPRGQILEPGFRVIFPVLKNPVPAGRFRLSEDCEVLERRS